MLVFNLPVDEADIKSIARTSGDGTPGSTDVYTITLKDDYTQTFTIYQGKDGAAGYSPVRGTDYWTPEDIDSIKAYVDEAILGGEW